MSTPNYKLKGEHAASIAHVRELYAKVVAEFATLENTYPKTYVDEELGLMLKRDGTRTVTNTLEYQTEPILANRTDIPHLGYALDNLALKADQETTYTKTEVDGLIDGIPEPDLTPYAITSYVDSRDSLKADKLSTYTKTETDTLLSSKKNTATFDTKIQNSTGLTSFSCDTDRYISIKSNGTKLCDILEDEQNAGMTILTNNKRFNVVSTQPQTLYHNSPAALFNFKYTDDGNQVAGQARFGQIQLAPSNTTNLNPALTFTSSRVNGLGTAGAIFLDSSYGSSANPLIISPQSLTDAGGNQFSMLRSTATLPAGTLRNTFTGVTGSTAVVSAPQQFATKNYVDSAVSGLVIPDPDLTPYLPKSGGTMTGDLFLNELYPTEDLQASTKKYVDDKVEQVTGLVDKNQIDGAIYKLDVDNNRVNFYRGDGSDKYLEIFGSTSETNGTVTLSSKRDIMRLPTLGTTLDRSEWQFGCGTELANGSPYTSNALFRILGGNNQGQAYTQLVSSKLNANGTPDGTNTSIIMYPRQTGTALRGNFIEFRDGAGYTADADYGTQDGLSILSRAQNDDRYELKGQGGGGGLVGDLLSEQAADPINIYLDNGTIRLRKNVNDFMAFGEMSALGNPFLRTVDRYEWEQQALISSVFSPAKQSRVFSILDETATPSASYPQFIMDHNRDGDLRLSTFNYLGAKTQLFLHPGNLTKTNHIEVDRMIGYRDDYTLGTPNDFSIIPRGLCDSRYALKSEIPTVDTSQLVLNAVRLQLEDSIPSQPQVILKTGTEEFIKFKRSSSNSAQIITHPFLQIQSNNIAPNYEIQIKQGLQALKLKVNGLEQTAEISNSNSAIKFDDYQTNQITFTGRPGLEPSAFNVQTNNNSFLTKAESVALFGSGGGGGGAAQSQIVATDTSTLSISNGGFCTIADSTGKTLSLRADSGAIFQSGNQALNLVSRADGTSVDGGALTLWTTTQTSGLCNEFRRATGYSTDVSMVSQRQFTSKAYVDGLATNYLSSGTTLTQVGAPTSSLSLNNQKIINLADPTSNQDAATKAYVLAQVASGGNQLTYGTQVLLGNVPFSTGSTNTVYPLAFNTTNFPTNPSGIITGVDWVRQTGRSDTVRLRVKLDPAIVNGRNFTVYCQPQTKFANASGGPTDDWDFGDSLNRYVLQTFNIDVANTRYYVHVADISDTASENLLLNMLIAF